MLSNEWKSVLILPISCTRNFRSHRAGTTPLAKRKFFSGTCSTASLLFQESSPPLKLPRFHLIHSDGLNLSYPGRPITSLGAPHLTCAVRAIFRRFVELC